MGLFKKKQEEMKISDAAIKELKRLMDEEDPKKREQLAINLKTIRQAEIAENSAKAKSGWWNSPIGMLVASGLISASQILLIMKGEAAGEMFNSRLGSFMTKLKKPKDD